MKIKASFKVIIQAVARLAIISIIMYIYLIMALPSSVDAALVKLINNSNVSYHDSVTDAYSLVSDGGNSTILVQEGTTKENINFNRGNIINLRGGYNSDFTKVSGGTSIQGSLIVSSGTVTIDRIVIIPVISSPIKIIYLHQSTGYRIWFGGVNSFFDGSDYQIDERSYPDTQYTGGGNYPYDFWKLWVDTAGPIGYQGQDTLDTITANYDVISFKHCYPVSEIELDTGNANIASDIKTIENYKLQYNALKTRLHQFPSTKFIIWTGPAQVQEVTTPESAERANQFFDWVKYTWDEPGDNIYIWDFRSLETEGGLYLKPEYASGYINDSHPNENFSAVVAPYISHRIVDVIEGIADWGSLTGQ